MIFRVLLLPTLDLTTFEFHVQTFANQLLLEASTGIDSFKGRNCVVHIQILLFSFQKKKRADLQYFSFDIIAFGIIKKSVNTAPFIICDLPLVEY